MSASSLIISNVETEERELSKSKSDHIWCLCCTGTYEFIFLIPSLLIPSEFLKMQKMK